MNNIIAINPRGIRDLMHYKVRRIKVKGASALEMLRRTKWNVFTEGTDSGSDIILSTDSYLGRMGRAAALTEIHFPGITIEAGEVRSSYWREATLMRLRNNPPKNQDDARLMMLRLSRYERIDPVVIIDGKQFDPELELMEDGTLHPKVVHFPIWQYMTAYLLVISAISFTDMDSASVVLNRAEVVCYRTSVVLESMAHQLFLLGNIRDAVILFETILEMRETALTLFALYTLTGEAEYRERLISQYSPSILGFMNESFPDLAKAKTIA